ncbi:hypothetical protein ABZS83_09605 [Streptomyces sp. NPDC005426]|uniref:hypothetical protein n=1 Tax=Streptomyces sp. NPDC005426 TaxID=3155344 RepID=UPI0033ACCAC2
MTRNRHGERHRRGPGPDQERADVHPRHQLPFDERAMAVRNTLALLAGKKAARIDSVPWSA